MAGCNQRAAWGPGVLSSSGRRKAKVPEAVAMCCSGSAFWY